MPVDFRGLHRGNNVRCFRSRYFNGGKFVVDVNLSEFWTGKFRCFYQCPQDKVWSHAFFTTNIDVQLNGCCTAPLALANWLWNIECRQIFGCSYNFFLQQQCQQGFRWCSGSNQLFCQLNCFFRWSSIAATVPVTAAATGLTLPASSLRKSAGSYSSCWLWCTGK